MSETIISSLHSTFETEKNRLGCHFVNISKLLRCKKLNERTNVNDAQKMWFCILTFMKKTWSKNAVLNCISHMHQSCWRKKSKQNKSKRNHLKTMLNRHNSMTSIHHQPVMPFKWRPFDLYNDIHVNDTQSLSQQQHDTIVCKRPVASNCVQSYHCDSNHRHAHLGQVHVKEHQRTRQRHRQSSRGSSSGGSSGSCASVGRYFVNDIDNSESNVDSTIASCGSVDCFCCKLDSQRMANNDKMSKSTKQQQQQQCYQQSDCDKCCTPNCRNNSSKYTKVMNNHNTNNSNNVNKNCTNAKSLVNRVVVMPFDGIDYTYKCEQSMIGTLNHCESPVMTTTITSPATTKISTNSNENNSDCTARDHCAKANHCCCQTIAGYFDNNWTIGHKNRPNTDNSKYIYTWSVRFWAW